MSKSILYAVNTSSQTVIDNGNISFGNAVRRYGNNCAVLGTSIVLEGAGYYDIDTNITLVAGGAGNASITLYKDGTEIPGATATLSVASGDTYTVSVPCVVRNYCCKPSVITAVLSSVPGTITNASIVVRKD